ncbi:hypothetical protein BBK14_10820 [Parafrankia soli]|uniref:Uncharacterized protein n=1 Tax=Parafrankia soli TaxID=2599596 RepID=A0A1S1RD18_9ACTN|nr:DUF6204 family protein [Parafrankia soli]OHV43112.1 hypothetical protein BBK14_10820 [Parafrankia soli]
MRAPCARRLRAQSRTVCSEEAARAWLGERGYGYKHLWSTAEDLSQTSLGKRQRRAAAGQGD